MSELWPMLIISLLFLCRQNISSESLIFYVHFYFGTKTQPNWPFINILSLEEKCQKFMRCSISWIFYMKYSNVTYKADDFSRGINFNFLLPSRLSDKFESFENFLCDHKWEIKKRSSNFILQIFFKNSLKKLKSKLNNSFF